ncbi:MAG: TRAP transporter small permease [Ignavibacteria bacterium]|jgi:TRAP-type C4-dicarboxylate transport system permease small subunit
MILRIKDYIDKFIELLLIILMGVMVINVLWQVFTRFILNDPSSFTDELARFILIWLGLLGAGYVTGKKMHLAIDFFLNKFSPKRKRALELFINVLVFLFALFAMFIGGINLVSLTLYLKQISASLQIQLGYVYMVVPLSGFLIMFYSIVNIIESFKNS